MPRLGIEIVGEPHGLPRSAAGAASLVRADRALLASDEGLRGGHARPARRRPWRPAASRTPSSRPRSTSATRCGGCARRCRRRRASRAARSSTTSRVPIAACRASSREANAALEQADAGRAGPCPSAISATATSTTTSRQPMGMDKAAFLARWDEINAASCTGIVDRAMAARSPPSTASAGSSAICCRGQGSGRAGDDAGHQGDARPRGDPEPRQGALTRAGANSRPA